MTDAASRPLGRYRVVELPGAVTAQFGKAFADLGAEVIKVEPPGGDCARSLPPFAETGKSREISLYWAAYAAGKQSVTADIESDAGRELIRSLAACSDVVTESFLPGYLTGIGLGFDDLKRINPGLVMTSISSFGQTGPYADRRGSDLLHFAMSGYLYMTGPPDGRPLKPSAPYQTFFHASMQAMAATMLALRQRRRTGRGAHVDQAMRDTGMWMLTHTYQFWDMLRVNLKRQGATRDMGGLLRLPSIWKASDGYVVWLFQTGHIGGQRMRMLVEWMAAEAMAPEWMLATEWETLDLISAGAEVSRGLAKMFAAFFATKTKAELFDWALARGVMLAPVQTLADVSSDVQLAAREAWFESKVAPEVPPARMPGTPVRMSAAGWEPRGDAPDPGQHNRDVYGRLLGLDPVDLIISDATGAV